MTYSRPPFPRQLFEKFNAKAEKLGYTKRASRWKYLDKLLDFSDLDQHTRDLFRAS